MKRETKPQKSREIEITGPMIRAAARVLCESGALAEPMLGAGYLAQRVLYAALAARNQGKQGSSEVFPEPHRIAVELEQHL